jgi:hypothetical protein
MVQGLGDAVRVPVGGGLTRTLAVDETSGVQIFEQVIVKSDVQRGIPVLNSDQPVGDLVPLQ